MLTMTGTARPRWAEPTRSLSLHWGSYIGRYLAGLMLIVTGGVALQGSNSNFGWLITFGLTAHAAGWWILPAAGWRRICATLPGIAGIVLIAAGPDAIIFLALPYVGWLLVRHRPLISWLTLLPVAAAGILIAQILHEYSGMLVAIGIMITVIVGSAWLARLAARSTPTRSSLAAST
jgi:hypothetical protein